MRVHLEIVSISDHYFPFEWGHGVHYQERCGHYFSTLIDDRILTPTLFTLVVSAFVEPDVVLLSSVDVSHFCASILSVCDGCHGRVGC